MLETVSRSSFSTESESYSSSDSDSLGSPQQHHCSEEVRQRSAGEKRERRCLDFRRRGRGEILTRIRRRVSSWLSHSGSDMSRIEIENDDGRGGEPDGPCHYPLAYSYPYPYPYPFAYPYSYPDGPYPPYHSHRPSRFEHGSPHIGPHLYLNPYVHVDESGVAAQSSDAEQFKHLPEGEPCVFYSSGVEAEEEEEEQATPIHPPRPGPGPGSVLLPLMYGSCTLPYAPYRYKLIPPSRGVPRVLPRASRKGARLQGSPLRTIPEED